MRPEVSVIMYVKNGMPYFKRALQSVLTQTFQNIEILVIDGGSTDGTVQYTQQCRERDSRIRLLFAKQGSVGAQFNQGLREARGEYLGIVESDDYILPEMYEKELACAREQHCDILRADNFIFFGSEENEIRLRTRVSNKENNYNRPICASKEPENVLIGGSFWTGLYRRKFLIEKNIRMNETPGAAYQDFSFLFLTGVLAESIYLMPKAYYCYRKDNPGSSCNRPDRLEMPVTEYHFLEKELRKRGLWKHYKEYFLLWKIRNERWFYFNLEESMKKSYMNLLYEDITKLKDGGFSRTLLHTKETELLDAAEKGREQLYRYLKEKEMIWEESTQNIIENREINQKQIYLFGAGNIGRLLQHFLEKQRAGLTAYTDNRKELWGKKLRGLEIIPPREAVKNKEAFFIICSENYAGEIDKQLRANGVDKCRIAVCDDMDTCIRFIIKDNKYLLFGTGDYYERYKKWFPKESVLALMDNSPEKQGRKIDGLPVMAPKEALRLPYERIVILSFYVKEMRRQLTELGANPQKIYHFYDLHDLLSPQGLRKRPLYYWERGGTAEKEANRRGKKVLLMSHDLNLGGPALALLHAAITLKQNGWETLCASMTDGPLRERFIEEQISVVVDENLQIETMEETLWVKEFDLIICNTINYYVFLSERQEQIPVIWWLHDSEFFYEGVDKKKLGGINQKNLRIVSVGPVPREAMRKYLPNVEISDLLYGVEMRDE